MAASSNFKDDIKSPWLLGILALVAAAMAGTIWLAIIAGQSSPNLVSEDYYENGQNYFQNSPKALQGPQWRLSLVPPAAPVVGQAQTYRLYVVDEAGQAVSGAVVTLHMYRPSDANADFEIKMNQADIGTYTANIRFDLPGTWDLIAQVQANDLSFDLPQRVFIKD